MELQRQYKLISCAECRRLKLRCNRIFPCTSCQKRGCAEICPNGKLPAKRISRSEKITDILAERIRTLESALEYIQASHTDEPHALLSNELRELPDTLKNVSANNLANTIKKTTSTAADAAVSMAFQEHHSIDELSGNLGTLSLEGYGKSRFFGRSASTVHILMKGDDISSEVDRDDSESGLGIPQEILAISCAFIPTHNRSSSAMIAWIEAALPPHFEAWRLCEIFFENAGYIFVPLRRLPFMEEIFYFFYGEKPESNVQIPTGHRLALLLMVFSLGEMFDLTRPPMPTGGKKFYHLARAAIALEPLYEQPTLTAVQAITLMLMYLLCSDHKDTTETAYVLSGINVKLAFTLGLHRELRRFTDTEILSEEKSVRPHITEEELRRVIFHEVIHFEGWLALRVGRPSIIRLSQFDCEPPGGYTKRDTISERTHMQGQAWSYNFLRSCLFPVLDFAVNVKPPSYSEVLKLDQTIRSSTLPAYIQETFYEAQLEDANHTMKLSKAALMERFSAARMREILLLYLHRPYFAVALTHYSNDPLHCPMARSVLASFSAACSVSASISLLFAKESSLSVRIWIFWDQLFVPCVFAALVIRSPGCKLAQPALSELDKIAALLERAKTGSRPSIILPHVVKFRDKAHAVHDLYYSAPDAIRPGEVDITKELIELIRRPQFSTTLPATRDANKTSSGFEAIPDLIQSTQAVSETEAYHPVEVTSQLDWDSHGFQTPNIYQANAMPQLNPEVASAGTVGTHEFLNPAQPWQNNLDALLLQSNGLPFPSMGETFQDAYWGTDVQLTWDGFIAEMLQVPLA